MYRLYQLSETEQVLHRIINDSRVGKSLDVPDVTHELATINHVIDLLTSSQIKDIETALRRYKFNLMAFLEEIK
jgi:hypothetical protein